jgi:hypothetical protein
MRAFMTSENDLNWASRLKAIEDNKNRTYNSTIKATPDEIWSPDKEAPVLNRFLPDTLISKTNKKLVAKANILRIAKKQIEKFNWEKCARETLAVYNSIKNKYSNYSLGGDSEIAFLDKPVQENNLWRLSTINNFTYHLGNTKEDWMQATFDSIQNETHDEVKAPTIFSSKSNKFLYWLKVNFLGKILFKKEIWRLFLQYKGLSKSEAKDY